MIQTMTVRLVSLCIGMLAALPAAADMLSDAEILQSLQDKVLAVESIAGKPIIVQAVTLQNEQALPMELIHERDEAWSASKDLTDFKKSLQESDAGRFLKLKVTKSENIFSEAFLTDNQGANVAAFPATSDYWQGDEIKFTEAFNKGNGKVYIGGFEFDDSSQTHAAQISVPVKNAEGQTIGVLIMGIKLSHAEAIALRKKNK